jgi:hypothetical protein
LDIKLLLNFNGDDESTVFTDSSEYARTVTPNGNVQLDTAQYKFGSASGLFNGTSDYLECADSDDFFLDTNDFTISCWYRPASIASGQTHTIFSQVVDANTLIHFWVNYTATGTATLYFRFYLGGVTKIELAPSTTFTAGTWYHLAVTRKNGLVRLYKDGISLSNAYYADSISNLSAPFWIGRYRAGYERYMNGHLDDFVFTNDRALYADNFTPPAIEFTGFVTDIQVADLSLQTEISATNVQIADLSLQVEFIAPIPLEITTNINVSTSKSKSVSSIKNSVLNIYPDITKKAKSIININLTTLSQVNKKIKKSFDTTISIVATNFKKLKKIPIVSNIFFKTSKNNKLIKRIITACSFLTNMRKTPSELAGDGNGSEPVTIGEFWKRVLAKLDELSVHGVLRTEADNIDYRLRGNRIINEVQKDIAKVIKIAKVKHYSQYPPTNQLGDSNYNIYQHINADISYQAVGSLAFYFEVDSEATVYIEEETATDTWSIITTINATSINSDFVSYRGKIIASNVLNNIRIRFSGSYPYQYKNVALYTTEFKTSDDVPSFGQYLEYVLPINFYKLDKISFTSFDNSNYCNEFSDYYWTNPTTLLVNKDYKGLIKVHYWAMPSMIQSDDTTPTLYDAVQLEVMDSAIDIMVSGVAGRLLLPDVNKQGVAMNLINFYESEKYNMTGVDKVREKKNVRNIWGGSR